MAIVRRGEGGPIARRVAREWDPFQTMRELMSLDPFRELMPRLWRGEEIGAVYAPAFDVKETKDAYMFKADLPGIREEDLDINITGNRLTVSGKREAEQVEESETYFCSERTYGSFSRSFTLPEGIKADQVRAELKEGVLALHVPKTPEAQPKRISVSGAAAAPAGGRAKA
jgi:HSP20 family protein